MFVKFFCVSVFFAFSKSLFLASSLLSFFFFSSFFERVIIHLSLVHSNSLAERIFIKSFSNFSLMEISILPCSKLTRLTLFSSSYFNLISFFTLHKSIKSLRLFIDIFLVLILFVSISLRLFL